MQVARELLFRSGRTERTRIMPHYTHSHLRSALVASAICLAAYANTAAAAPITYGAVSIWEAVTPGANILSAVEQALPTNPIRNSSNLIYTGTFTGPASGNLNFGITSGPATIAAFLSSGAGTFSGPISGLNQTISASNYSVFTLMEFAFTLATPQTITLTHDDGFSIYNSSNTTALVSHPEPTTAIPNTFTLAAGHYNLWYGQANGLPAVLNLQVNAVPEPASLAVIGAGIAGLGLLRRRRRT
jgi:hypothetical protein